MASTSSNIEVAIRKAFRRLGYTDVKEEQLKAAREFMTGRDVFVCLPTGSAKSCATAACPMPSTNWKRTLLVTSPGTLKRMRLS